MEDRIIEIYSADSEVDAQHMKYVLEEAGISAKVVGQNLQGVVGEVPVWKAYPKLWVHENDAEQAVALIEQERLKLKKADSST